MKIKFWTIILLTFLLGMTLMCFVIFKTFSAALMFIGSLVLGFLIVFFMLRAEYNENIKEYKRAYLELKAKK